MKAMALSGFPCLVVKFRAVPLFLQFARFLTDMAFPRVYVFLGGRGKPITAVRR
jgi:hypothetical protein